MSFDKRTWLQSYQKQIAHPYVTKVDPRTAIRREWRRQRRERDEQEKTLRDDPRGADAELDATAFCNDEIRAKC